MIHPFSPKRRARAFASYFPVFRSISSFRFPTTNSLRCKLPACSRRPCLSALASQWNPLHDRREWACYAVSSYFFEPVCTTPPQTKIVQEICHAVKDPGTSHLRQESLSG